ncbi:heme ABC transporter permease CcmC [Pelagibacteraceae bacterium]|nr:heme ABC transporter permease CcmC [Pelagibacteraceae bacterium]
MNLRLTNKQINIIEKANPFLIVSTIVAFTFGLYFSLLQSPPDYIQGDSMRIMYIHVPSAWFALMAYTILAGSSVLWFITRNPVFSIIARSIAQIGMIFTLISLVTGSIWGKPTWGVWWVWDARLTSMLLLFFLYLAYIFLWQSITNKDLASKISAALAIVGFVNIPIIKFSVDWWNTLHQPATISKLSSPSIDISMMVPLFIMTLATFLFLVTVFFIRLRIEILDNKILRIREVK